MGSGSTGGAGYGNKTGEMSGPGHDSMMGKVVEKFGGMLFPLFLFYRGDAVGGGDEDDGSKAQMSCIKLIR